MGDRQTSWARGAVAIALRAFAATGPTRAQRAVGIMRHLPARWHRGQVVRDRIDGFDLALHLDDNVQRELYYLGAYERPFVRYLTDELLLGDVVLDVGAHVGIFTLPLARRLAELGGGRVIAVEASPSTAGRLRQHLRMNGLDGVVIQAALTDAPTEVGLRTDPLFGSGDNAVRSRYGTGEVVETVPGIPFDDWAREHNLDRLDVVKMDIEGAELEALRGMHDTLTGLRPRLVTVECKDYVLERAGTSIGAIDRYMREIGYHRQPRLSQLLGVAALPHVDDNVLYRPEGAPGS